MAVYCPSCVKQLNPSERIVVTPCGHLHHQECFKFRKGERSKACPVCQRKVLNNMADLVYPTSLEQEPKPKEIQRMPKLGVNANSIVQRGNILGMPTWSKDKPSIPKTPSGSGDHELVQVAKAQKPRCIHESCKEKGEISALLESDFKELLGKAEAQEKKIVESNKIFKDLMLQQKRDLDRLSKMSNSHPKRAKLEPDVIPDEDEYQFESDDEEFEQEEDSYDEDIDYDDADIDDGDDVDLDDDEDQESDDNL